MGLGAPGLIAWPKPTTRGYGYSPEERARAGIYSVGSASATPGDLVDEPAEPILPDDLPGHVDGTLAGEQRAEVDRAVRPGRVVVLDELP